MTGCQVRMLLDLAWDVSARVDNERVVQWTQLQGLSPLDVGFRVRIAEKFICGRLLIVPKSLPLYAKNFLRLCEDEERRFDQLGEPLPSLNVVDQRRYIEKLIWLGGLDSRGKRYVDQLYGFSPFTPLKQVELAEQEHLSPPAIAKRMNAINRRLVAAAHLSQLQPVERRYAFLR